MSQCHVCVLSHFQEVSILQLTCPLVFYSSDLCITEVPVLCQDLPFPTAEVLGGQAPHDRTKVLCLWLVVLLEAQRPPHPGVLLTTHVILKPRGDAVFYP